MKLLSLTFHAEESVVAEMKNYLNASLVPHLERGAEPQEFILSEVAHAMVEEGKNFSLILFFEEEARRSRFLQEQLPALADDLLKIFGHQVMIFDTELNPLQWNLSQK